MHLHPSQISRIDGNSLCRNEVYPIMSMNYMIQQASDATISELHRTPALITSFVSSPFPVAPQRVGFLSRLLGMGAAQSVAEPVSFESGNDFCDLGKGWHGLHFLFTGSDWKGNPPASFLLNWGCEIGNVDLNYGPARSFTSAETIDIYHFLESIHHEFLRAAFNPSKMMELEIYPFVWNRDESIDELLKAFDAAKSFVQTAVSREYGLVVHLG